MAEDLDGVGGAGEVEVAVLGAAIEEHRDLHGRAGEDDRLVAAQEYGGLVGAGPVEGERDPRRPGQPLAGQSDRVPDGVLVTPGQLPRRPGRLGATDVLVVDDVLERVEELVDDRQGERREPPSAQPPDERLEVFADQPRHAPVSHPGQEREDDARGAEQAALADEQMSHEVLDVPAVTQGEGAGPELQGEVAEGGPLAAGQGGTQHPATLIRACARLRRGPPGMTGDDWEVVPDET